MKKNLPVTQTEKPFPKGKYVVSRTDLKGAITYGNDTFVELSGFTRDELMGKNHNMVRHPDMPPAAFEDLWRTAKGGRPWRGIVKNRCKNGDYYWVEALVVPVRKDNQTIGYMSVRTEPTRQQIQEAESLYARLNAGAAKLPAPSAWKAISMRTKQNALLFALLAFQLIVGAAHFFGGQLGGAEDTIVSVLGALSMLAIGTLFFIQQGTMTIIDRIIGRLDNIAQGNLTDVIPLVRQDELGKLNDALVTMQTHMKSMMAEISEAASQVSSDAQTLEQGMAQTRRVSQQQSDASSSIAAAVEQLVVSVQEVADSAQQAVSNVRASHELLGTAATRMNESRDASRNVVTTVNSAGQTMAELFQSIFAIGRITEAIKEISEQTNLLALNAAIEAARAGEQGRGFAVVADEVRKLAEKAKQQTDEISATVSQIQFQTQTAVSGMESAGTHVTTTEQAVEGAQASLTEVSRHGEQVIEKSLEIAQNTRQQSSTGGIIATQVEGIVRGIDETTAAVTEANHKAEAMKQTASRLRELISYFRIIR